MRTYFPIILLAVSASAVPSGALLEYLPEEPGFTWHYWGFAEYGHTMRLVDIIQGDDETVFMVSGMVEDVSGGEAQGNFSMKLKYTVTDSCLILSQHAPLAMDSDFPRMELLRLPLEEGASWTQTAGDTGLLCEIESIDDGVITVRYSDMHSEFYHLREFEPGLCTTVFEKLYISPDGSFEIGYTLFRPEEYQ
ncbi:MAG TPA: hypothetical protein PK907_00825 [Candidatus Sabulitectum sp.]|nr:hypothetical protein [Candidatus Sabulitectum sp.]